MTDKPDTSREAVEALAKTDREKFVMMGPRYLMMKIEEMADVLRALLDERDALKAERDEARSRFNDIDLCRMGQAPCKFYFSGRRAAFDLAADACDTWGDPELADHIRSLADKEV